VDLQWKDGKVEKIVIKSSIGGNLRVRIPNRMSFENGEALKAATGDNANLLFQSEKIPTPVVSHLATVTLPRLKETFIYDIATSKGKTYTLITSK
jgi:alpha-L-fucosidase 2